MNGISERAAAKRQKVIEAASLVFRRHGFARTSMEAIAEAAGISRPSLYLVFANKEEAFAAAVDHMGELALDQLRQALPAFGTLQDKLAFICEQWAGRGYDRIKENPDARDLTDPALAPVRAVYGRLQGLLAELLADAVARSGLPETPGQVAGLLVAAMRGFKDFAADGDEVRRQVALQVALILRGLDPAARPPAG
jgi:AcrR family transcriptional regulator